MCLCQRISCSPPRTHTHLVVTKQRRPTGSIKCLFSPIIGCLKRGRVPTLMNKWREKWEGSKLEGKTEESIELWLHTPSLSQTLSNPISRSRLLPSLRLCCYGDVCSRPSCRLRIVSKWRREKASEKNREMRCEPGWEMEQQWKLEKMQNRWSFRIFIKPQSFASDSRINLPHLFLDKSCIHKFSP